MKKVVLVLATTLTLLSCEKETTDCGCYRIVSIDQNVSTVCKSEDQFGKYDCLDTYSITYNVISECTKKPSKRYKTMGMSELKNMQKIGDCYNSFSDY